jgi:hypothetical protein
VQAWSSDGVRQERTGWRDEEISARHRTWGFNCPCVDLDFVVTEYNLGLPVALVEYKHFKAQRPNPEHPTFRALTALCDGYKDGPLPFFVAFYWPDIWAFEIMPINAASLKLVSKSRILSEREYVTGLYSMRRKVVAADVVKKLNHEFPQKDAT